MLDAPLTRPPGVLPRIDDQLLLTPSRISDSTWAAPLA
jgi:hypothetical protein